MNGHGPEDKQSMKDQENPIAERSRALFNRASEHLDPATGNRLRLMRRDVLAGNGQRRPQRWLPLAFAAAMMLAIGASWWLPQRSATWSAGETTVHASANTSDQDLLPEDDTEIYAWLGDAPVAVNDDKAGSR